MELNEMVNIMNVDVEKAIQDSIEETFKDLDGLVQMRTCKIYSSYVYRHLKDKHVMCKLIDTVNDFGMDYQHFFVVVPKDFENRYVVDLTYRQFGEDKAFLSMYEGGYQLFNDFMYELYLNRIGHRVKGNIRS